MNDTEQRIGVFICHCGENIAGTVDVEEAVEFAKGLPNVVYATEYMFMCSKQGTEMIKDVIKEHNLTGTVVASCSHEQHWKTFADVVEEAGLNPHRHCQVNVREFVSWVTDTKEEATEKVKRFIAAGIASVFTMTSGSISFVLLSASARAPPAKGAAPAPTGIVVIIIPLIISNNAIKIAETLRKLILFL